MELEEKGVVVEKLGDTLIRIAYDPNRHNANNLLNGKFYQEFSQRRELILRSVDVRLGLIEIEVNPILIDKNTLSCIIVQVVDELTKDDDEKSKRKSSWRR